MGLTVLLRIATRVGPQQKALILPSWSDSGSNPLELLFAKQKCSHWCQFKKTKLSLSVLMTGWMECVAWALCPGHGSIWNLILCNSFYHNALSTGVSRQLLVVLTFTSPYIHIFQCGGQGERSLWIQVVAIDWLPKRGANTLQIKEIHTSANASDSLLYCIINSSSATIGLDNNQWKHAGEILQNL